jgi:hypothetical protein
MMCFKIIYAKKEKEHMRSKVKIVLLILVLAGICFFANIYISFGYGSLGGLISEMKQPPDEKTLASRRADVKASLTGIQDGLSTIPGLTLYAETYSDMCAKGEHGWKRSDSFAYQCAFRLTRYYGTSRDYKALLLDLNNRLQAGEWDISGRTAVTPTLEEVIAQASGDLTLVELPDYIKRGPNNPFGGYTTLAINSFSGYGVPWMKSNDEPSPFGFGLGIGQTYYEDTSKGNPEAIANQILAAGEQPLMFAVSRAYFSN